MVQQLDVHVSSTKVKQVKPDTGPAGPAGLLHILASYMIGCHVFIKVKQTKDGKDGIFLIYWEFIHRVETHYCEKVIVK